MTILPSVFDILPCKECNECSLILSEKDSKRKGCASHLQLLCCSCGWKKEFFTSSKVSSYFEVNRRFVYALQSISQSFCQNIPNFVPKFASSLRSSKFILKITSRFLKQSIWLDYFNSWANRGFVYKLAFKFEYELLNFATNLRTLERNLEYFGKSFVKSTVSNREATTACSLSCRSWQLVWLYSWQSK